MISARRSYATIELVVTSLAGVIQLLGTGRIINRFGVKFCLLLNPVIMVFAFLAIAFSPILLILGGLQVVRRVAEYAVAKPTREDALHGRGPGEQVQGQERHRHGRLSRRGPGRLVRQRRGAEGLRRHRSGPFSASPLSLVWFPIAWALGKRYETARSAEGHDCRGADPRALRLADSPGVDPGCPAARPCRSHSDSAPRPSRPCDRALPVELIDANHLDVRRDVVLGAEQQDLLGVSPMLPIRDPVMSLRCMTTSMLSTGSSGSRHPTTQIVESRFSSLI